MAGRWRRGVSPIIATLLLIIIAVAGAVITYAFVTGLVGGTAPQAPSATISVDSVTSNGSHVLLYVRNTGAAPASVDRVYVEQGGSLVAVEDVSVAIPPGTVGNVAINRGALGSGITYVFKIFCGGNTMPTAYSSGIGGGAGLSPTDTTPPICSGATANDTVEGMPCLFSSAWSDDVALSGFVFSTNLTGSWTNSSWSAFSGGIGSAVAALPSAGTVVGYRFYANDTSDNWDGSGVQYLTTGHYVWVTESSTVVTGYTDPTTAPSGTWANPTDAFAYGGNYASTSLSRAAQSYGSYGFSLPSNTTSIDSIVVLYRANCSVITNGVFGRTTADTSYSSGSIENRIRGYNFTLTAGDVYANSITVRMRRSSTGSSWNINCAIYYADNGTLIAQTGSTATTLTTTITSYTFNFPTPPLLYNNTKYRLAVWSNNPTGTAYVAYSSSGGTQGASKSATYGTWPNPLTGMTANAYQYDIYCSYTPASSVGVFVTWDGGMTNSSRQYTSLAPSPMANYTYNVTSAATWTYSALSDANLKAYVISQTGTQVNLDWLAVNVTYTYDSSHWEYTTVP